MSPHHRTWRTAPLTAVMRYDVSRYAQLYERRRLAHREQELHGHVPSTPALDDLLIELGYQISMHLRQYVAAGALTN